MGSIHLDHNVLRYALNWILNISRMGSSKLPGQWFEGLKALAESTPEYKFNWYVQLKVFFESQGELDQWHDLSLDSVAKLKDSALENHKIFIEKLDRNCFISSKSWIIYPHLIQQRGIQFYLLSHLPLFFKRIFAQIRH